MPPPENAEVARTAGSDHPGVADGSPDYAAVLVLGFELVRHLQRPEVRSQLHPELQAELQFGLEQSTDQSSTGFAEGLAHFLARDDDWKAAEADIVERRGALKTVPAPASVKLRASVLDEISYYQELWAGRFSEALEAAKKVLGHLSGPEVQPYRAFWNYLAGSAAFLAGTRNAPEFMAVAKSHYVAASSALPSVPWLNDLKHIAGSRPLQDVSTGELLPSAIEGVEAWLDEIGGVNAKRFESAAKLILDGLSSSAAKPFENGLATLGAALGFSASRVADDNAAPDVIWRLGRLCLVFEAHTDVSDPTHPIGANKVRQAKSHPDWAVSNKFSASRTDCIATLVSPCSSITKGAAPHSESVQFLGVAAATELAKTGVKVLRELWLKYSGPGNIDWRASAIKAFSDAGLAPEMLRASLLKSPLSNLPQVEG